MAKRLVLGKHQQKIVKHLSNGILQSGELRKKTKLNKKQFEGALGRLATRKVVHITKGTRTAADGEVYKLKGRAGTASIATREQSRSVMLSRIYQGRHGVHR